jgi:hypothetical protein
MHKLSLTVSTAHVCVTTSYGRHRGQSVRANIVADSNAKACDDLHCFNLVQVVFVRELIKLRAAGSKQSEVLV